MRGKLSEFEPELPTFRSFCKNAPDEYENVRYPVVKVWYPNKFPSLSLETEKFRLRISQESGLYGEILELVQQWEEAGAVPYVAVTSTSAMEWELDAFPNETGEWEEVGEFGRRVKVNDRKKSLPSKRRSAKRDT